MTCCHSLTCCAHSDCISAPALCKSYFCRCLIVRSCKLNVNTFLNLNATLRCTLADHILKTLAMAARHMGMEICGISCITNMAAGISKVELNHKEVQETADRVAKSFKELVTKVVVNM